MQTFGLLPLSNMHPLCESIIKEYKILQVFPCFLQMIIIFEMKPLGGGGFLCHESFAEHHL